VATRIAALFYRCGNIMISIVCVYNNEKILEQRLLYSLKMQHSLYEVLTIDNRTNRFTSAASALNWGASLARGDWIIFAHQDISLLSENWLKDAKKLLQTSSPDGWVGIAGVTRTGEARGFMLDRAALSGTPFKTLLEVQTLDECLLIHRREKSGYQYFDNSLSGWHAYGVEACCRAICEGKKNYVIPLLAWHDSPSSNWQGLETSHSYVFQKYARLIPKIYTTCGVLPDTYEWQRTHRRPAPPILERLRNKLLNWCGFTIRGAEFFWGMIETLTENEPLVGVFHKQALCSQVEVQAFVPLPNHRRRIIHHFCSFPPENFKLDCIVIAPTLTNDIISNNKKLSRIFSKVRRLLVCLDLDGVWMNPEVWQLIRQSRFRSLVVKCDRTLNMDGVSPTIGVFEFS
jgi:Glycosyltransferase like family